MAQGSNHINQFVPNANPYRPTPNFVPLKSFAKVGRRARKISVGRRTFYEIDRPHKDLTFIFRTSTVRKQAVQLLTQLLQCNPFDASLCVDVLKERHTEESAKLVTLMPKDDAVERAKKWLDTEKALNVFLKSDKADADTVSFEHVITTC